MSAKYQAPEDSPWACPTAANGRPRALREISWAHQVPSTALGHVVCGLYGRSCKLEMIVMGFLASKCHSTHHQRTVWTPALAWRRRFVRLKLQKTSHLRGFLVLA